MAANLHATTHYPVLLTIGRLIQLLAHVVGAVGLVFDSQVGKIGTVSPTARHCCDVSSELYCVVPEMS